MEITEKHLQMLGGIARYWKRKGVPDCVLDEARTKSLLWLVRLQQRIRGGKATDRGPEHHFKRMSEKFYDVITSSRHVKTLTLRRDYPEPDSSVTGGERASQMVEWLKKFLGKRTWSLLVRIYHDNKKAPMVDTRKAVQARSKALKVIGKNLHRGPLPEAS